MALLRIGSRGSALALWQANHIAGLLRARGYEVEIEVIKTTGDKVLEVALSQVGAQTGVTKGIFTKEIEDALADRRVDLAVHSLKDLPTRLAPDFEIAAIPPREDVRDAFCSVKFASIAELPKNARVGTSSLRRQAQLKGLRPDIETIPLRGNVDTRLRKLAAGDYDAIILAAAGLNRLGQTAAIRQLLPIDVMCPAAGQGALAIEIRAGDTVTRSHVAFLDDPAARATSLCERSLLDRLGGGCQVPLGASATLEDGKLNLSAVVASPDGKKILRQYDSRLFESDGDAAKLGQWVGEALLSAGADALIRDLDPAAVIPIQAP